MRYRKASLSAPVKSNLRVEFTESGLTSYAGLELLIRYFRAIDLNAMIRRHFGADSLRGDYGVAPMMRLVLGLLVVGGRRLRHVEFVRGDELFHRFCGLTTLVPTINPIRPKIDAPYDSD